MKKGFSKIIVSLGAIALLFYLECMQSSYKNTILENIGISLYENGMLAAKMEQGPLFLRLAVGNRFFSPVSRSEKLAKGRSQAQPC